MHKVRDFFKKLNNPLIHGITFVIIGLAFILLPLSILDVTVAVIGAVVFIFGLFNIIFIGREAAANPLIAIFGGGALMRGIIEIVFGISLILIRSAVGETVCDVLGILIMLYSGFKLLRISIRSAYHGTHYRLELALYSILLAIGLFVLIFPLYPHATAGGALIAVGAKLIADSVTAIRDKKDGKSASTTVERGGKLNTGDYYTDDFVDKSDK